ncbi:hypothetical protein [Pseudomonas sp. DSP3-2-2]|uniref:hypothetical protein n=1 Tax=unclassified Pseudomonas TaxID=196821 RepID=UPI003CF2E458
MSTFEVDAVNALSDLYARHGKNLFAMFENITSRLSTSNRKIWRRYDISFCYTPGSRAETKLPLDVWDYFNDGRQGSAAERLRRPSMGMKPTEGCLGLHPDVAVLVLILQNRINANE